MENNVSTTPPGPWGQDLGIYGNVFVVEEGKTINVEHSRFINSFVNDGTMNVGIIYVHGYSTVDNCARSYSGEGTVNGDIYLFRHANTTMESGTWNGLTTVDAVNSNDKNTSLHVKSGATIDGIQVRVLNSVPSGNSENDAEAATAQDNSYDQDDGANVNVPVLFYHRLMNEQKKNITVTYDYNGGLDAQGWSGIQRTTADAEFTTQPLPAPELEGYVLAGWKYAVDNEPETLDMTGDAWFEGEAITESLRLIAQWTVLEDENTNISIDKTATELDEYDRTDVTLTVGGGSSADDLGVDIIYILGGAIARDKIESDTLISCLRDTMADIVKQGTTVNFGMVPYSSDDKVVMELTALEDEEDLAALPGLMADAMEQAGVVYDGVNMENALAKAKKMFSESELADHPERQHLVLISSGFTYFFNSGEDNDLASTVPVNLNGFGEIFYTNKAWMQARNANPNTYPIPKAFEDWDTYWSYIDTWAKADVAAGDPYVYVAGDTTDESFDFIEWFNSGTQYGSYRAYGAKVTNRTEEEVAKTLVVNPGANPLTNPDVAHAIGYERAMWEAYEYAKDNIIDAGINFYPIYNALSVRYNNGYDGSALNCTWTDQYIGHSFMNMLAGGEAVQYMTADDKAFFDPIKREIVGETASVSAGTIVEDFMGYNVPDQGNFEFIQDSSLLKLTVGDVKYKTSVIGARNGATSSYAFAVEGAEPTFWLDYFAGNGTDTEKFIWTFGETVVSSAPAKLTYKLQLIDKVEEAEEETTFTVNTNLSAVLHPVDSKGEKGEDKEFPIPFVEYKVDAYVPEELGSKDAELLDRKENRYQVYVDVPGGDDGTKHDEVILMVDGSYSMDNEWPAMKEAITTIGKTVLDGNGVTQLTLMAFGMGDNEVLVHVKTADELAAALGELPGNLLYGRSSTNCEAGFDGVASYIKNHDNSLKDVHVIFISDGNINTDETPRAFDTNWKLFSTNLGAQVVATTAFENAVTYGENLPEAFATIFGDRFDGATRDDILSRAFTNGEVTNDEFMAFADAIWADVYEYSNLTPGEEYPVSVAERAFVKYDKEKDTYIQDAFYYSTYKSSHVTYGNRWTRTPIAADNLAALPEVAAMYVVDYDSETAWMKSGITSKKSTFVKSNGIAGLCDALSGALDELARTPFNDVVVTDYMSKWVTLDPSTLQIIDNNSDQVLWTAAHGWAEGVTPLTENDPVVVELVPNEYPADDGETVEENKNGSIYRLTWHVKDGALLRSDNFRLAYEVNVDVEEEGFVYEEEYPANGETKLTYTDKFGKEQSNLIEVPDVNALISAADLKVKKVDENGDPLSGAEFELFKVEGDKKTSLGVFVVDENGEFEMKLQPGTHLLVETKAPTGYLTVDEDINISVDEDLGISVKENKTASMNTDGDLVVVNHLPHAAVVLTIDMSGTMYRYKMNGKRYVDVAKAKAVEFVNEYAASGSEDAKRMLAVVCFDTDAKVQQNWIDVSTASGLATAVKSIKAIKVADNGSASSNQVCTNFDAGVILTRNLLKQDAVKNVDRCFNILLSDGAPTVTVNSDTDTVGTIKSSFWGNQLDATGKKYQNARAGGGWTHPAEVSQTLTYLNGVKDLTCSYTVNGEKKEGIFIVGVGGQMSVKLFNDAVYGTSNGTRTSDVKKKPAAFNNVDALQGYTQAQILKLTTGDWMGILADRVGGTYASAANTTALNTEFTNIINAIKDTTTPLF